MATSLASLEALFPEKAYGASAAATPRGVVLSQE